MSSGEHAHSHSHIGTNSARLAWALAVTGAVLVAELIGATLTGSLSLLADAGHMVVDSSGLVVALIVAHLVHRPRNDTYTWGLARAEVLAAALQAGMLIIISLSVAWEALTRFFEPITLASLPMLWVGFIGLVANIISLLILAGGRGESLNMRAAFLEVANDALGSVAVIVAALLALTTGWNGGDAIASLCIAAFMIPRAILLLRSAVRVLMEGTPVELNVGEIRRHMEAMERVDAVHDLHVSTIQSNVYVLTAHITAHCRNELEYTALLRSLEECAAEHFPLSIGHTTFQLEPLTHRHEKLVHQAEENHESHG